MGASRKTCVILQPPLDGLLHPSDKFAFHLRRVSCQPADLRLGSVIHYLETCGATVGEALGNGYRAQHAVSVHSAMGVLAPMYASPKSVHTRYVTQLEAKLWRTNRYAHLKRNLPYRSPTSEGELDLFGLELHGSTVLYDYYEVKCSSSMRSRSAAQNQINRWADFMGQTLEIDCSRVRGYFVFPERQSLRIEQLR